MVKNVEVVKVDKMVKAAEIVIDGKVFPVAKRFFKDVGPPKEDIVLTTMEQQYVLFGLSGGQTELVWVQVL